MIGLTQWFRRGPIAPPAPLYKALIGWARDPWFYTDAHVPDSLDGRFDMVALMVSLALIRLGGEKHQKFGQALLEHFVRDMDSSLRELGVGDMSVGKHIKRMAQAFAGRHQAYRRAAASGIFTDAVRRNMFRGEDMDTLPLSAKIQSILVYLAGLDDDTVLQGRLGSLP